jgi:hypothetical protein
MLHAVGPASACHEGRSGAAGPSAAKFGRTGSSSLQARGTPHTGRYDNIVSDHPTP